jgi:hypothetical protein
MHAILRGTTIAIVLVGGVGLAVAGQINLTSAQQQTIYQGLSSEKGQAAPATFQAKPGAKVPDQLAMHQLPSSVTNQVSAAKGFEYAKLANNEVVLIDPKDRQVAEVIMPPPSTTGSKK